MTDRTPPGRPAALYLDLEGLDPEPSFDLLRRRGVDVVLEADRPDAETLQRVVALMVGYQHVGASSFERLPGLKLVATHSAGIDMVDVAEARRRELWVTNVPAAATEEVAVHALSMLLSLVRDLPGLDADVRAGRWHDNDREAPRLPADLTLGIVGVGQIGTRLAELAAPLFGSVVGHDPQAPQERWPAGVERLTLPDLLSRSNCISLHAPATPATSRLLGRDSLARLPRGAVVVNVARGSLVDESALLAAIESGQVAAAALDVLDGEPPPTDHPLLSHPRVLLTPHVAYLSPSSLRRYVEIPARNVLAWWEHGRPLHPVLTPSYQHRQPVRRDGSDCGE
ncbi:MAG: C-terminal binding protein [Nocardioidaceae bacterium]